MNPTETTFASLCLATQSARTWYRRGIIEADSVKHLIHIASYAPLPSLRAAARRVCGEVGCSHMIVAGERRGAAG